MQRFNKKYKGEITIFLALILSTISLFISQAIINVRHQMTRQLIELLTVSALHSCFSEYGQAMYKRYGLMFIDSSYLSGEADINNVLSHIRDYINVNLEDKREKSYRLALSDIEGEGVILASDNEGDIIGCQIIEYMKHMENEGLYQFNSRHKESVIIEEFCGEEIDYDNFITEWVSSLDEVENYISDRNNPSRELLDDLDNVLSNIYSIRSEKNGRIYGKKIPSERKLNKGILDRGLNNTEYDKETIINYVLRMCGNYGDPKDKSVLCGEVEYILYGEKSDEENCGRMIKEVLSARLNINKDIVFSNNYCMRTARKIAVDRTDNIDWIDDDDYYELLSCYTDSILYATAFAESVIEVYRLFNGESVTYGKGYVDLIIDPYDLERYESYFDTGGTSEITYRELLRARLINIEKEDIIKRFMDIVEVNIREFDNENFRIDGCIEYLDVSLFFVNENGKENSIRRNYGYVINL